MKLKNPMLVVTDMERSVSFYQQVLGLRVILDFGANKTLTGGLCLQTAETYRGFIGGKEIAFGANNAEVYFEEDDFDAFAAKLRTLKIDYVHPVLEHAWGQRVVRIYDPDRHIIEVGENLKAVCRRFLDGGLTPEQAARRMDVPLEYVRGCMRTAQKSSIVLHTQRLELCMASDEEMRTLIAEEPDEEMKAAYGEMLAGCEANPAQRQWYAVWFICLSGGERIGDYCFKGLTPAGMVEIGYGLLPEYWGRGYATEAVRAAVAWALEQPGVRTVEAETEAENAASRRVLAKAGFVPTGRNGEEGPCFVWRGKTE